MKSKSSEFQPRYDKQMHAFINTNWVGTFAFICIFLKMHQYCKSYKKAIKMKQRFWFCASVTYQLTDKKIMNDNNE